MWGVRIALLAALALLPTQVGAAAAFPRATAVLDTGERRVRVAVEVADEPAEWQRGLMQRRSLARNAGMVFVFPRPIRGGFWMKDTLIPLSIAFWGPDERIGAILDMEPCRKDPCTIYDPGISWVGALEVNQGFFAQAGVSEGDPIRLER